MTLAKQWYDDMTSHKFKDIADFTKQLTTPNEKGQNKHFIVEFFGPACGFCTQMMPDYNRLSDLYNSKDEEDFMFSSINA